MSQVTLAHGDAAKLLCVYMHTCDLVWSGIFNQVPKSDLITLQMDQRHESLD